MKNPRTPDSSQALLWLVALGFFMQTLDTTIVNTALPAMAKSLGEHPLKMHMVIIAYVLSLALLIPASGWLADRFGTRRVFIAAVFLFTLGSLFCAQSQTLTQLIIARVIQGIGGSMLMPVGRLAVLRAFPREKFLQALSFITIPALIGPLIGPTLGGWLVKIASWHWIFLINLPFGLIAAFFSLRLMPDFRDQKRKSFDFSGYGLLAFSMVAISMALDGLSDFGFQRGTAVALIVTGLAALAAYWLHAARNHRTSLFSLALFRIPSFSIGIFGNLFARIGNGAMPFLLPLLLQVNMGYSPFQAGLMMVPAALAGISAKGLATPLINRFGYRRVLVINTLAVGFVIAAFALLSSDTSYWWLLPQMIVFGTVNSLQFTAMNTVTLKDLPARLASSGNSLLSMVMQLSLSLGVSVAGVLLSTFSEVWPSRAGGANQQAFQATFICMGLITFASTWIFWQLNKDEKVPERPVAVEQAE